MPVILIILLPQVSALAVVQRIPPLLERPPPAADDAAVAPSHPPPTLPSLDSVNWLKKDEIKKIEEFNYSTSKTVEQAHNPGRPQPVHSQWTHDAIMSLWRRFDVKMTLLLRVPIGLASSQREHNAITMSFWRQNDVASSFSTFDVIMTLSLYHVPV